MSSRLYDHSEQGRRYRTPGPPASPLPPLPSSQGSNSSSGSSSSSHHQNKRRSPSRPVSHSVKSKTPAAPYAMSDGHSDDMPARKRIAVACGRCRKRKIRCSGDPGGGMPCTNCKTANADGCQFLRVSSQPTSMRHDGEGGPGSQHLDCGYNIEVSRASATRGSMPPLQVPYGAEMGPHGPMMPAFQPRASTTAAATNSSYYGSGSAARPTPASSASSTSAYNYGWSTTAPSSGDYDEYYSRDASIQQPYYPMETVMGYAPWSAAGSGAASRSRSGAVSGTGSMESLRGTGSSVDLVGSYEYSSSPHDSTSSTSTSAYAGSSGNASNVTGRRSPTAASGSQTYIPLPTPPQHHAAAGSSHLSSYAYGSYGGASSSSSSSPYHHGQQQQHASTSGAHSSSSPYSTSGAEHAHHGHVHTHHHHHHHHASGTSTPSGSGAHRASVGGRR